MNTQLAESLKEKMVELHLTMAVAESVTAGHIQALLSLAPGAFGYFQGGVTAYNLGQKAKLLGIDPIHAEEINCVSEKVAKEMAKGVCRLFSSDYGLGITGYVSPDTKNKTGLPIAYLSIARYDGNNTEEVHTECITWTEHPRQDVQVYFAEYAAQTLLKIVTEKRSVAP